MSNMGEKFINREIRGVIVFDNYHKNFEENENHLWKKKKIIEAKTKMPTKILAEYQIYYRIQEGKNCTCKLSRYSSIIWSA